MIKRSHLKFALLFPTVLTLVYFLILDGRATWVQNGTYSIGKIIQFGLPAWLVWRMNRVPLRIYKPRMAGLVPGIIFGAGVFFLVILLYKYLVKPNPGLFIPLSEKIQSKMDGFQLNSPSAYLGLSMFYCLLHSGMEEYYWRWFVFRRLLPHTTLGRAIVTSSLGFMAHHVVLLGTFFGFDNPFTYIFSAGVAVGGAAWAGLYHRSGNIYAPWLSHALVDAAIFWIGYDILFLTL
jgi:membrane protease YdiL (CAAX protease family)